MLRGGELDIESIGIKLGYVERRSFTHAFQKWQGQTQSAYRKAMRRR
jgi:AraC-like DNA-binding protein